jgi:glutathione S-transferase
MPEPRELVLWGTESTRTLRVHWALHELAVPYSVQTMNSRSEAIKSSSYSEINPRQKIPFLQDGTFSMGESSAIVAYLSYRYSNKTNRLIPEDIENRARWLEFCFYAATELDATSLYIIRRHRDLQHIYGEAPAAVSQAAEYFKKQLVQVERTLSDGRVFLVGEQFTSADILVTSCLALALHFGIDLPRSLHPYLKRMAARPAYQKGFQANFAVNGPGSDEGRVGDYRTLLQLQ